MSLNRASSVMRASVMPSAKYSCPASPETFSSGKTASDCMGRARVLDSLQYVTAATNTKQVAITTAKTTLRERLRGLVGNVSRAGTGDATVRLWFWAAVWAAALASGGPLRSTGTISRYPRRGRVSTKRGDSARSEERRVGKG